jgi:RND family efflux transporter MFP subunit
MTPDGSTIAARLSMTSREAGLRRPRIGKTALWTGAGLVTLLALGVGAYVLLSGSTPEVAKPAEPVLTVTAVPVQRIAMADTLLVNGSLTPWEDLTIGSEASGLIITKVFVDEGDWVKTGQILAKLNDSLLQAQLRQTEAQIAHSQAMLKLGETDARRAQELLKTNAISVQGAEQREATFQAARADLSLAEAQRSALMAQLAQTEIRAPTDGLISQRTARLGKVVSPVDPLFREVRDGILELDAEIPDRLLARVQPGQKVKLRRGDGGEVIGTVRAVAPLVDTSSRNGIAHVRFPLDPSLKAGMFVSGELVLAQGDTLAVPEAAVLVRDGRPYVFVLVDGERVTAHAVETGQRANGMVSIRGGLGADDRVVTAGAGFLHDGDVVKVAEAERG